MSTKQNSACNHAELVRDYAFDELAPAERKSLEQHLGQCSECASQLDGLRLTTAALRVLPDLEVPRRIVFASDRAAETGWFGGFWNSVARPGFAAVCLLALGLSIAAYRRTGEVRTVAQTASASQTDIEAAVNRAVALAVDKAHADDLRLTKAALDEVDSKYARQQQNLMVAMGSNMELLRKSYQQAARTSFTSGPVGVSQ
jgi:anti-sigma factor RsiW